MFWGCGPRPTTPEGHLHLPVVPTHPGHPWHLSSCCVPCLSTACPFRLVLGRCSHVCCAALLSRTVYEDSGPGRPLSCFMEEPAPYTDSTGAAAGGGDCRFVESPSQDQRLQAQRLRNPEVRGSLQTPQNRPHGHQSPELPEGYGERTHPATPECERQGCIP